MHSTSISIRDNDWIGRRTRCFSRLCCFQKRHVFWLLAAERRFWLVRGIRRRDVQRDAAALPRAERLVAHFAQEERLPVAQQEQAHTRLAGARLPSPPTGTLATVHSRNVSVPVGCMLTHRAASAVDILLLRARRADLQDEGHIRVVHAAR